jgi:hypothetical protein
MWAGSLYHSGSPERLECTSQVLLVGFQLFGLGQLATMTGSGPQILGSGRVQSLSGGSAHTLVCSLNTW